MPRTKPSKTEELRVTLGTKERMLLEEFSTSYRIQSVAPSIAELLTDGTALYALGTIYEIITGRDIPGLINPMEAADFWNAIKDELRTRDTQEERTRNASSFLGGLNNLADFFFSTLPGGEQWEAQQNYNPSWAGIGGEHPDRS